MPKPPLPKEKLRDCQVCIKVNKLELKLIKKYMAKEKLNTMQQYIRQAIYRDIIKTKETPRENKPYFKVEDLLF